MGSPTWLERLRRLLARGAEGDARKDIESTVRESLLSPQVEVREGALRLLLSKGHRPALREEFARLLTDPEPSVRHLAAVLLDDGREVPGLWEATLEAARAASEPGVRQRAMAQLPLLCGEQEARSAQAVRVLEEALEGSTRGETRAAVSALGSLARGHGGAAEVLIKAFRTMPEEFLEEAMLALSPSAGIAEGVIHRLMAALENPQLTGVRRGSMLWWLGECARGAPSPQVVELLVKEFWSPSGEVIESAVEALCRCEDIQDALRPRLLEALEDRKLRVLGRFGVAVVLGHFGERAAIPHLVSLLEMHDSVFPLRAMARSDAEDADAGERTPLMKYRAVRALGAFGRQAETAIPALVMNLLMGSRVLRKVTAEALVRVRATRTELIAAVQRLREHVVVPEWESEAFREVLARAPEDAPVEELPRAEEADGLEAVLARSAEELRRDGARLSLLVGAVLEAPEPERVAAVEKLRQVLARKLTRATRQALTPSTVKLLDDPEVEVRLLGARLVDPKRVPAAIPGLRRGLGDAEPKLREACVAALRGEELSPQELSEHLRSERAEEREAALELLDVSIRGGLRTEVKRLLADPVASVRHLAAERLDAEPEEPGAWEVTLDAVRGGNSALRRSEAVLRLRRFGLRSKAVPVLIEALRSDADESVRQSAASVLADLAPVHEDVAEALLQALRDASSGVGEQAASSLAWRGATTEALVPRLLAAVEDSTLAEEVRGQVALTLAELKERAVVPALVRVLERPDDAFQVRGDEVTGLGSEPRLKLQAVRALGTLGPLAAEAVPALLARFPPRPGEHQLAAAEALERMGAPHARLEELLCEALREAEGWSRWRLLGVLARVRPEQEASLRALVKALVVEEGWPRTEARTNLWRALGDRPELVERLHALTHDEEPTLRSAANEALWVLGRPTAEALEQLARRLESPDESERQTAIGEVRMLGSRAGPLLRQLTARLPGLGTGARVAVLSVLGPLSGGKLGGLAREALAAGLGDAEARVREAAAWALCDFTGVDAEWVRRVEALLGDAEADVRETAAEVLRALGASRAEQPPRGGSEASEPAARAIEAFAFQFHGVLRGGEGNSVFSPISLFTLLTMLLRGTRGATEAALRRALRWDSEPEQLSAELRALTAKLHTLTPQKSDPHIKEGGEGFTLVSASGFWSQEGYPLRAEYLAELAKGFGVTPTVVDFARAPEAAGHTINAWASEHTRGRIPVIVQAGELSAATRYVLANAVYFRSRWAQPFYEGSKEAPFQLLDGREVDVRMMSREGRFGYARGEGCQLITLPYQGGHTSMGVLLPDAGFFERFERLLSGERVRRLLEARTEEDFVLKLPRFSFDQSVNVTELAQRLGLSELFGPEVDLSGMTLAREPFTGALLHEANITVDEKGTEAAAATRVFHIGGVPQVVEVNRPFLFLIWHEATGTLLFMGRVLNPRPPLPQGEA
jgi:serpin B